MGKFLFFLVSLLIATPALFAASTEVWYNQINIDDYDYVDPKSLIPTEAKKKALAYFELYKDKIPNKNYLTIFDAKSISSKPSAGMGRW